MFEVWCTLFGGLANEILRLISREIYYNGNVGVKADLTPPRGRLVITFNRNEM